MKRGKLTQTDMRILIYVCFILVFSGAGVRCQVGGHTLSAPQIIREGVMETIVLNLHGVDGLVSVSASINLNGVQTFNFPYRDATLPIRMEVKYEKPPGAPESNRKQYVELIVTATKGGKRIYQKSLTMRVVESRGYIHVQTDKPIYRPEEVVKIRVVELDQKQAPEPERDIEIVIKIPLDNVAVEKKELRMPRNGFIETSYKIPENPVFGVWSIGARFKDEKVARWYEINFAVRPYVLPTINVELTLDKQFVLVKEDMSDEYITGTINSKYSSGKTVTGSYFLAAKLTRPGFEQSVMFYQEPNNIVKKATISNGKKAFKIRTTNVLGILQEGEGFSTLHAEKASVTIEVSVTGVDGVAESDVSPPIVFVVSPYKIDISRTSKYYTPGRPFEIKADVLDSISGKPLSGVEVVLTGKTGNILFELRSDQDGQIYGKINMEVNGGKKQYKLMTRDFSVPEENEAKVEFTLYPYESPFVLQLSAVRKIAVVGEKNFNVDAWFKPTPKEIKYVIFARGNIVSQGLHIPTANSLQTNIKIQITADMAPSFRIVAYFFHEKEVVSNSVWVDVKDACEKVRCKKFYGPHRTPSKLRTTPSEDQKEGSNENMCECVEDGCLTCRTREEQLRKTSCLPDITEQCQICDDPSKCYNLSQAACESNYVYEIEIVRGVENETAVFVEFEAKILTVYKKGSDFTVQNKGQTRLFSTRRDCYKSCVDQGLVGEEKAAVDNKLILSGRKLLIFGKTIGEQNWDAESPNLVYHMDDRTMIERIIPAEKCKSSQAKTESRKCRTITEKSKPKLVESCTNAGRVSQACRNVLWLRRMLIKGCEY